MSLIDSETYVVIVPKKGLTDLSVRSFMTKVRGHVFHGFVVRKGTKYFAYQNLCQHLPVTLDLEDGDFFTHDKAYLQCQMHGAMYEIETGFCTAGPCQGARLTALTLEEEGNRLVVRVPKDFAKK